MGLFNNKNIVNIAEDDLNDAKLSSIEFNDELTKKRAFIDVLGARLAMKILFSQKMEANNIYSMYTIQSILEKIDIADIHLGKIKMDVRLVFSPDEIFIPKAHFEYDVTPDIYLVLSLNGDLSSAEFMGFFEPNKINKENCNSDFYFIEKENLTPAEQFKKYVKSFVKVENAVLDGEKENAKELFLPLVDKELEKEDETVLFNILSRDLELREELVEFENFEALSNKVAQSNIIKDDNFLDVIGAQLVAQDELPDGLEEVTVDINDDTQDAEISDSKEEEIPEKEVKEEEEEKKDDNNKGLSIVEGAAIAGGLAVAGTVLSAGAAAAAENLNPGNALGSGIGAASVAGNVANAATTVTSEGGNAIKNVANAIGNSMPDTDFKDLLKEENDSNPEMDFGQNILNEENNEDLSFDDLDSLSNKSDDLNLSDFNNDNDLDESIFENNEEPEEANSLSEDDNSISNSSDFAEKTSDDIFDSLDETSPLSDDKMSEEKTEENEISSLPDIDFGDSADFSDETLAEDKSTEIEPKSENKDDLKDEDDKISPAEQIEDDPDALEELHSKIKDSQIASMPDYFTNVNNEIEDSDEEISEDNTENASNEEPDVSEKDSEAVSESENADVAEEVTNFDSLEEADAEINPDELPEINISGEPLVDLDSFDEVETTQDNSEKENKEDEDVVSLDNFDFEMFENQVLETQNADAKDTSEATDLAENNVPEETSLPEVNEEPAEPSLTQKPELAEESKFSPTLNSEGCVEDYDNEVDNAADAEISDITSQVDAFLSDIQLNDTEKSILADEIDIDENILKDEDKKAQDLNIIPDTPKVEESLIAMPPEEKIEEIPVGEDAETLEVLFKQENLNNDDTLELGERVNSEKFDKKKAIIAASVAGAIIISLGIAGVVRSTQNKDIAFPKTMNEQTTANSQSQNGMQGLPAGENAGNAANPMNPGNPNVPTGIGATGGQVVQNSQPGDMGRAVSNAFTSQAVNAQVSKIAWEVPEDLSYNAGFRRYLQTAGKNLKLSLQNDLLLATEMAYSNKCVVDVLLSNAGTAQNVSIISTSGSKQIDGIVLQSVKETLNYLKAPINDLNGSSADLTLIINF